MNSCNFCDYVKVFADNSLAYKWMQHHIFDIDIRYQWCSLLMLDFFSNLDDLSNIWCL